MDKDIFDKAKLQKRSFHLKKQNRRLFFQKKAYFIKVFYDNNQITFFELLSQSLHSYLLSFKCLAFCRNKLFVDFYDSKKNFFKIKCFT